MADADVNERLRHFSNLLGTRLTLVERALTPKKGVTELLSEECEGSSSGGASLSQTPRAENMMANGPSTLSPAARPFQPEPLVDYESHAFDCSKLYVSKPVHQDFDFCPWKVVESYPDFFIGKTNRPRARPFFSQILQGRVWDFFYMHDLRKPNDKPQLLVPTTQFQAFLDSINRTLGIALKIPEGVNAGRFYMKFCGGIPRPRYLMRNRDTKTLEVESWPTYHNDDFAAYQKATPIRKQDYENFMDIMSRKTPGEKSKSGEQKAAKRKQQGSQMLKDAQAILRIGEFRSSADAVLLCFDVEALERAPHPISEIGIAILDVKDLCDIAAGPCGRDWWPMIKAYHLRTKEYAGLVNFQFVKGCPDDFEFGTSTFPAKADLASAVMAIIQPYIDASRKLVLVGHDFDQDSKWLSKVGVEVYQFPNLICHLDSQVVHSSWRDSQNGRGLRSVLTDLHIPSKHLHNAGNDAVYTLRALIGVAIEQIRERDALERGEEYEPGPWA